MHRGTSILVVDGRTLERSAIAAWLRGQGFTVAGEVELAQGAPAEAVRLSPGIILLELGACSVAALDAARAIGVRLPETRIICLVSEACDHAVQEGIALGLSGYFSTNEPPERLAVAIRTVLDGEVYFSPQIRERMLAPGTGPKTRSSTLTPRETEVLCLLARGLSKRQIGETISLSTKTVDNHCTSIMAKLNIHNRVDLARYAIREGFAKA